MANTVKLVANCPLQSNKTCYSTLHILYCICFWTIALLSFELFQADVSSMEAFKYLYK